MILTSIIAALSEVGNQLSKADHMNGYHPFPAIDEQHALIRKLTTQLSDSFRWHHADMVDRLVGSRTHLYWCSLMDEVHAVLGISKSTTGPERDM